MLPNPFRVVILAAMLVFTFGVILLLPERASGATPTAHKRQLDATCAADYLWRYDPRFGIRWFPGRKTIEIVGGVYGGRATVIYVFKDK